MNKDQIKRWWEIFHIDGSPMEVRIVANDKYKTIYSGYYKNLDKLIKDIESHDSKPEQIYFVLNELHEGCYSREQREQLIPVKTTTSDNDIIMRRWLLIDIDPIRPQGISSTDEELAEAHERNFAIWKYLEQEGFPKPVVALSGNGYHLLYKCEIPVSKETDEVFKRFLQALAQRFDDDSVKVDQSVFNRARISKLYGVVAKKGSNTKERPWRDSRFLFVPAPILPLGIETIKQMTDKMIGEGAEGPKLSETSVGRDGEEFDLREWLDEHGIGYRQESMTGGKKYVLEVCPFNSEHKAPDSAVFQMNDGTMGFHCFHNSCSQYHWRDFRLHYEPDAYEPTIEKLPLKDDYVKIDADVADEQQEQTFLDGISQPLTDYLSDCSNCFGMPRSMVDAIALTVLSSAIGNKVHVHDGAYHPNLSIWCVCIAPSGTGKTPLLDEVLFPVKMSQETLHEVYMTKLAEWNSLPKKERGQQEQPYFQKRFLTDCTPESMYQELSRHPHGLLLMRDEIAGWIKDFNRYNDSGEVQNLLSIFNGQSITITRKTSEPVFIIHPFMSVIGGIQPEVLAKTFNKEGFVENGFLGRFLWCCPPCEIWEEYEQRNIDNNLREKWNAMVNNLYTLAPAELTLSSEALEVKKAHYSEIKRCQKQAFRNKDLYTQNMYGKAVEYTDRIAGILHVLENASMTLLAKEISATNYEKAVEAMSLFLRWGLKVRGLLFKEQKMSKQDAILTLNNLFPILNQSKFAEAVGVSQQYINKILKKK